jgi:membrane dipeptidase
MPLLFDSHLDLAWNALSWKRDLLLPLAEMNRLDVGIDSHKARGRATVSLPEMRSGQVAACLATLMGRVPYGEPDVIHAGTLDFPRHENVFAFAQGQLAYYKILEMRGHVRWLWNRQQLAAHWRQWREADANAQLPLGIIIAMEGSDAICEPEQAELWWNAGLRCASLVHYGSSRYASGTNDYGPLTACGRKLLDEFARLGIILDVTHLCDQSFFQVMEYYDGPLLASHQNCRAIVPGQRQFSDEQLRLVFQRGGVVGIAFDAWMMFPGWERGVTSREVVSIDAALDHIDHLCQLAGNDRQVAIGSDLDGGFGNEQTPKGLDTIADLQRLVPGLTRRGYSAESIAGIFGENWFRYFSEHLPA